MIVSVVKIYGFGSFRFSSLLTFIGLVDDLCHLLSSSARLIDLDLTVIVMVVIVIVYIIDVEVTVNVFDVIV